MRARRQSYSIRGPIVLFSVVIVLAITLTVLWNVVLVNDYNRLRDLAAGGAFHWAYIALGSVLFLAIIVLCCVLGVQLIANIRRRQQQANFLATVSHELNSPLSAIKLFAQTLRTNDLAVKDRDSFIRKILFDVGRLSRIIANILRAAEVDTRGEELQLALSDVDLHAYLEDYLDDARALGEGNLDAVLSGETGAWITIDPMMFRQVLDNLVDNSLRYRGDRQARVEFRVVRSGGWIELRVTDQGIGMDSDELPRIFERFYRVDGSEPRTAKRGMGIGLNIVRSIVESHGGSVGAESDGMDKGAVIWLRLPAIERPATVVS